VQGREQRPAACLPPQRWPGCLSYQRWNRFQVKTSGPYGPDERWLTVVAPEDPDGVELVLHLADEPARARVPRPAGHAGASLERPCTPVERPIGNSRSHRSQGRERSSQ
jgi:hypothetical protein